MVRGRPGKKEAAPAAENDKAVSLFFFLFML